MFAEYNIDNFPVVYVTFSGKINSEEEFDDFLQSWLDLYHDQKNFSFIFDTREMSYPDLKYCFKMAFFIKRLRKEPDENLQEQDAEEISSDDFEKQYKGEVSKSGVAILPSKRMRKIPTPPTSNLEEADKNASEEESTPLKLTEEIEEKK